MNVSVTAIYLSGARYNNSVLLSINRYKTAFILFEFIPFIISIKHVSMCMHLVLGCATYSSKLIAKHENGHRNA